MTAAPRRSQLGWHCAIGDGGVTLSTTTDRPLAHA
jgi:hypothetical protein